MAYIRLTFNSQHIGRTEISIFYPQEAHGRSPGGRLQKKLSITRTRNSQTRHEPSPVSKDVRYQCLMLLHGGGGNFGDYPLKTKLQQECENNQLVVVMPTMLDYIDKSEELGSYYEYVTKELPEYIQNIFPVSGAREDNFIMGFSYGGFFSYYCGLRNPEKYKCVGCTSAPVDIIADISKFHYGEPGMPVLEDIINTDFDILALARKHAEAGTDLPSLFQIVGTEDFTWDFNIKARDTLRALGIDHTWIQGSGGHTYDFCDWSIREFMNWLPLKKMQSI